MTNKEFLTLKPYLPTEPGIYKYFDVDGNILYIGKARNIRNRVSSYFSNRKQASARLILLVRRINKIEYTIVDTEQDALLLESNLIKKHQPRYNIQLKDDKSFPFICIKKERFPRVFLMRNPTNDGSEYLGPYTSVKRVRFILDTIKSIFPLRTCTFNLSEDNVTAGKFKICLEHHIGNCLGPCENLQNETDYNESIKQVRNILKGNLSSVHDYLSLKMNLYAENYEFERAAHLKQKLALLETYQSKSTIVNVKLNNVDVYAILDNADRAYISYLKVANGVIIQSRALEIKKQLEESTEELLLVAINQLSLSKTPLPDEIIATHQVKLPNDDIEVTVPIRGDKKKLTELALKNCKHAVDEHLTRLSKSKVNDSVSRILNTMKDDLRLTELPKHIECIDNSNIQGTNPVASLVVFKNARPSKRDYRKFNIKTVIGANDFASMEEVVLRRYSRLIKEEKPLPQLLVVDGGKGQLSSALKSIDKLGLLSKIAVIGIAKRLEEIYFPNDPVPLYINKKSESLKVIQRMRDEAHRFAITFHRSKRMKEIKTSELYDIKGIGESTADKLIKHYKSVKRVKQAPFDELASIIGKSRATKVQQYFGLIT